MAIQIGDIYTLKNSNGLPMSARVIAQDGNGAWWARWYEPTTQSDPHPDSPSFKLKDWQNEGAPYNGGSDGAPVSWTLYLGVAAGVVGAGWLAWRLFGQDLVATKYGARLLGGRA